MTRFDRAFIWTSIVSLTLFTLYQTPNNDMILAQNGTDIIVKIANSSFAPMTNVHGNQLKISATYQVNNETLEDDKINGVMKVYSKNGTMVKYSSFPSGFIANKTGTVEFKTTIRDPALANIIANVTILDLSKKNDLSNTVTTNLTLQGPTTANITS
ncbi:MAG: hypothetical protein WA393_13655 [Nitrososphaeraceae archaeon]